MRKYCDIWVYELIRLETDDYKERVKRGLSISIFSRLLSQGFLDIRIIKESNIKKLNNPSLSKLLDLIPFYDKEIGKELKEKVLNIEARFDALIDEYSKLKNIDFDIVILGDYFSNENISHKFSIDVFEQGKDKSIEILGKLRTVFRDFEELISFSWEGMSYGEEVVIDTLAVLYDKLLENNSPSVIMIDEGDLGLHPEWQKKYVKMFETFLNILDVKPIQLILTSHSPFLISDLPKENIIFLTKSEKGLCEVQHPEDLSKTFGANIHSLFRNNFFLDTGLMGEFAKEKIDDVIKTLNERFVEEISLDEQKELQFLIQQIGEPIIQNKLQQMYDSTFHFDLQKRISDLESEIIELKTKLQ